MTKTPPGELYRLAPSPTPWNAYKGTKFAERFDDPQHKYLVLYGCSRRLGCFVECLAYFRVEDKPGFAELEEKFGTSFPEGTVPSRWCEGRFTQSARVNGTFADAANSAWIARLNHEFPDKLRHGRTYPWVDQSTIYQDRDRSATQWISRFVFDCKEGFAGVYYSSKLGADFSNWAVFEERASLCELGDLQAIPESDADLLAACSLLGLRPPSGTRAGHA